MQPKRPATIFFSILIVLIPLFLINVWGNHFADEVYGFLSDVRNITEGSGAPFGAIGGAETLWAQSVPFSLAVALFARYGPHQLVGPDPVAAAAVLSALGWSATAFAYLVIGRGLNRTSASVVSALLICFNPIIITSLGSSVSWTIALAWWAAAFLLRRRFLLTIVSILALMLSLLPLPRDFPDLQTVFPPPLVLGFGLEAAATLVAAAAWSLFLFLAGIGASVLADWLVTSDISRLDRSQTVTVLLTAVFLLLGGYQMISLVQLFQTKPEARWLLENEIAQWIQTNTVEDAVIGASERIGYLADRQVVSLAQLENPSEYQNTEDLLRELPVDYLVSSKSLPWQLLANAGWFGLNYQEIIEFDAPYVAGTPYTIWGYQPPPQEFGAAHVLNARVPDRLRIRGYQVNQEALEAEGEVIVTLHLETAAKTIEPTTEFLATIRLLSPLDFSTVAEWDVVLPQGLAAAEWQAGEQIIEQVAVSPPPDLKQGAYPLNLSLTGPGSPEYWPISLDNDMKRLDRIQIGYVTVPAEFDPHAVQSREALFNNEIKLLGFTMSNPQPGEAVQLSLFWQAENPIEDNVRHIPDGVRHSDDGYVVFTHVLDSTGQLVANHDSVPDNGRFPTQSWLPGMTIPDAHTVPLPADLPAGEYQVRVGMYLPDTGERLPVIGGDGSEGLDNSFLLTSFSIP